MENNTPTIEDNFSKIEEIITEMQSDNIPLDKAFELYNKGLKLVQSCNSQIDKIEKEIKILEEGNIHE